MQSIWSRTSAPFVGSACAMSLLLSTTKSKKSFQLGSFLLAESHYITFQLDFVRETPCGTSRQKKPTEDFPLQVCQPVLVDSSYECPSFTALNETTSSPAVFAEGLVYSSLPLALSTLNTSGVPRDSATSSAHAKHPSTDQRFA